MMTKREDVRRLRLERLEAANDFIEVVAGCGRRFFRESDRVTALELDGRSRMWLHDCYRGDRLYISRERKPYKFTGGGTLWDLVKALRSFVMSGKKLAPLALGPYPYWACDGDVWGYGDAMDEVRAAALHLEIIEPRKQRAA